MSGLRVLVCGDREWTDRDYIERVLSSLAPRVVIEGHCRGADQIAHRWAEFSDAYSDSIELICKPANWAKYGRAAGPIRNRQMADERPDLVLAFHDQISESKGTADMLTVADERRIAYVLYEHTT